MQSLRTYFMNAPFSATILIINWFIFILLIIKTNQIWLFPSIDLVGFGANFGPKTSFGESWRLLSSIFVHAGLLHIALNSVILIQIGPMIEKLLPRPLFIISYLTAGISGSLASLHFNYGVVSIGASGAIFGLFGVTMALLLGSIFPVRLKKQLLKSVGFFILLNLAIGLWGPIDNAAHIGGLAWGFLQGLLMSYFLKAEIRKNLARLIMTSNTKNR